MDKNTFQKLLTSEVESYKALLETKDNDWIVKGFIDVNKNVYTITNDTKVVSKIRRRGDFPWMVHTATATA